MMDLKYIGTGIVVVGLGLLLLGVLISIIIGVNASNMAEIDNKDWSDREDSDEDKEERAEAMNSFLDAFNRGIVTFGMGLVMIGGGFFLAGKSRGNGLAVVAGSIAVIVLLITLVLMSMLAINLTTMTRIGNLDDPSDADEDKYDKANEAIEGIAPTLSLFGGYNTGGGLFWVLGGYFNFNSLSFVFPMLTLMFGAGVALNNRRQEDEKKVEKKESVEPTKVEPVSITPPPPPAGIQGSAGYNSYQQPDVYDEY